GLPRHTDLAGFPEAGGKRQPYGDTEGDPRRHWPADPKAYYLYFMDDGTYGKEARAGVEGFWLRGGEAEVVLRALEPVRAVHVRATGGPLGCRVAIRMCGDAQTVVVTLDQTRETGFKAGAGFLYSHT